VRGTPTLLELLSSGFFAATRRCSEKPANFSKSNIQHPTSKIPTLLPVWNIAGPVLRLGKCVGLLVGIWVFVSSVAMAQTWTGATSGNFSVVGNWSSAPAYNGTTDLTFSSASANSTANSSNSFLGANLTIRSLSYDANADTDLRTRFTSSRTGETARSLTFSATSGSSSISIAAGSTANIQFTVGTGVGNLTASSNLLIDHNGGGLFTINPNINGSGNLTFSGTGNTTVTGIIGIGTSNLTKSGAGNLTLSGANTYNGSTTINGGTLKLEASGSLASASTLVISDGGRFDTTATTFSIGTAGLTLGVGASTAGFLNAGAITLGNGLSLDIASATPSASYDLWNFTTPSGDFSTVSLTGSGGFTGSLSLSSGIWSGSSGSYAFSLNQSSGLLSIIESAAAMYWTANGASLGGTGTWNGTNTNWSTSNASVSGTAWNPASTAVFAGTAGTVTVGTISANAGLSFQTTGYTLSSGTLTLGAASDVANAITVDTSLQATINSVLAGSNGMTKAGLGTLVLGGTNTYSGGTNVNVGTLQGTTSSLQGNIANNAAVVFDQTTSGTYSGNMSGVGALTKNGSGSVTLSGSNTYSGATTVNAGTLALGSNTALGDSSAVAINGGELNVGSRSETVHSMTMNGGALTIGSGTLTLNNASSFTGGTVTLAGSVNSRLNTTGTTALGNVDFVYNNGSNLGDGKGLVAGGSIVVNAATSANFTNAAAGAGRIELNADTTIDVGAGGAMNVSWTIDQFGGTRSLTKNGSGNLTLNVANTYSGGTTLNTGTLVIGHAGAAGSGTITQANATSLLKFDTVGTITNAMLVHNVLATQSATLSGAITVNNATWDIDTGDTLTISGNISGPGGLTKNGSGTLVLSGSNSYSAPTVINAGTLNATSAGALGNNATVQINGGTLLVTADDAINGKNIKLGGSGVGLQFSGNYSGAIGSLTLSADSIIDMGPGSVQILFQGLSLSSHTLSFYNWTGSTLWNGGTGADTDKVFLFPTIEPGDLNKISFYSGNGGDSFLGTGFDIGLKATGFSPAFGNQILPVPEPETWATAVILLVGGMVWFLKRARHPLKKKAVPIPHGSLNETE
jgi:autotransporter-associated beta strand protein